MARALIVYGSTTGKTESYTYFCGAVDALKERIQKLGGRLVCAPLKIDREPEEEEINEWTKDLINAL